MAFAFPVMKSIGAVVHDGIARITFSAGPANVIDKGMIGELVELVGALREAEHIRVVIFQSDVPDFFLNHLQLGELPPTRDQPPARQSKARPLQQLVEDVRNLPQATIAVVEGRAVGFGNEFLLGCDMVFALAGRAVFGQIEVALGVIPGAYGTQGLPRILGRRRALEMILGCDEIDASTAQLYGLVNRALDASELRPFVDRLAARIATFPGRAIALAKVATEGSQLPVPLALVHEARVAESVFVGSEAPRRINALVAMGAGDPAFERDRLFGALTSLKNDEPVK